jgi:hypothetical protein
MKQVSCVIPDSLEEALRQRMAGEMGPTLKRAFETLGPVLVGVHVDYRDNHKLFEHVHEHLLA